jgi:hypothetical protein
MYHESSSGTSSTVAPRLPEREFGAETPESSTSTTAPSGVAAPLLTFLALPDFSADFFFFDFFFGRSHSQRGMKEST